MGNYINWDDKLSVSVEEIDRQHMQLVALINELYAGFVEKRSNEFLGEIIDKMAQYALKHFRTEEKYFALFKYEKSEEHRKEHKSFVKQVMDFKERFEAGKTSLTYQVMGFLRKWLIDHIMGSDREYIACFKKNGL